MPDHLPLAQPGLQHGTRADVVHEGIGSHDDADVPEPVSIEIPGDKISGQVSTFALFYFAAVPFEKVSRLGTRR